MVNLKSMYHQEHYDVTASFIGYSSVTKSVVVEDIVSSVNFILETMLLGIIRC